MNAAVSVAGLVKVFGGTRALDGLDAELLILDEPTSGLDRSMEAVFQEYIREDARVPIESWTTRVRRGTRSGDRRTAGRRLRRVPDPRPQHRLSGPVHPLLVGGWPAARAFCAVAAS